MPAIDLKLRTPGDDGDRKLLADVERVGWHVVGVAEESEPPLPPYAFSVGMYYTMGSPEIVIAGLPHQRAAEIINFIGLEVRAGRRIDTGSPVSDILHSHAAIFRPVPTSRHREHLGYAVWFYHFLSDPLPCVQLFWPDANGLFPWDPDCQPTVVARQIDLTRQDR